MGREAGRQGPYYFCFPTVAVPQLSAFTLLALILDVSAHHFDVVYLGEAPDEEVDGDEGGGVRVVLAGGSDPGVVHGGAHHRVQDLLLLLPGHRTH